VRDSQLSLAIGKEGQNVRLAVRLTGWKIDIRSDAQVKPETGEAIPPEAVVIEGPAPEAVDSEPLAVPEGTDDSVVQTEPEEMPSDSAKEDNQADSEEA
jgi:N utilization substance protein A